jgi:hypothetical protein
LQEVLGNPSNTNFKFAAKEQIMLSDFRSSFKQQSERLDAQLALLPNEAERQLFTEGLEKEAQQEFVTDIAALGHEWSQEYPTVLTQAILDRGMDLRIPGCWVQTYIALLSEGVFEKLKNERLEDERQAELDAQPVPTNEDKAPSRILIPGNRTITQHRREGDEGISAEDMSSITPDKLDKNTMKRLKLAAGQSRREDMTDKAEQAMDRGERPRI